VLYLNTEGLCLTYSQILDETVNVYIVLQTPYFDERTLRSYLGRLVINLEAQVVNAQPENHEGPPGQETIYNGSVQDSEDPLMIVQGPDDTDPTSGEDHILVVWKLAAFLVRPRLRLQNPSVVFAATASLKPAEQVEDATLKEEYLPSQVPSGINLLEVSGFLNLNSHVLIMFKGFGKSLSPNTKLSSALSISHFILTYLISGI
jgi:hypothetical protein